MNIETAIETIIKTGLSEYKAQGYGISKEKDIKKALKLAEDEAHKIQLGKFNQLCYSILTIPSGERLRMQVNVIEHVADYDDAVDEFNNTFHESRYQTTEYKKVVKPGGHTFYINKAKPLKLSLLLNIPASDTSSAYNIDISHPEKFLEKKLDRIKAFLDRKKCERCEALSPCSEVFDPKIGCEKCWDNNHSPMKCSICLDSECAKQVAKLDCGHTFHKACIKSVLNKVGSGKCPLCRAVFQFYKINDVPREVQ
jgi:hypothetical protein